MDFSYSEDQEALRELARKILEDQVSHERLVEVEASEERVDREVWNELAKANLLGVAIDEKYGGIGLGLFELGILLEEIGRSVARVPVYSTLVLGALPIAEFGSDAQRDAYLPRVVCGDLVLTAALVEPLNDDPAAPTAQAKANGSGFRLFGRKGLVPLAHVAERVLVTARTPSGGVGAFLVDPSGEGASLEAQETTSGEPQFILELAGAPVAAEDVLGDPDQGAAVASWTLERAVAGLCAIQLGVAEQALRMTATYTSERRQFDRPVGSFQAVHQRAADAYIDVEAMRLTLWQLLHKLSLGDSSGEALAVAKFWASEAGARVTYAAQHLHGGIGMDMDYPLHRYYLWARQIGLTLGPANQQLAVLGSRIAASAGDGEG